MLSAAAIASGVRNGTLSAVEVVEASLRALDDLEPRLEAWAYVDREGALAAARRIDAGERREGALLGVPVGVKDIFDVAGLPTGCGAAPFAHTLPAVDSAAVARLRAAGAIILGKTATTQFAYMDPAATRNPWNPAHTPGGSSSGSAAAVAAGVVPLALGSQTVGSVLRPAAYCGIVGFKPSHGRIAIDGVFPLAPSFDHVGVLSRSVEDAALAYGVLANDATAAGEVTQPKIAVVRAFWQDVADATVTGHLDTVVASLAKAGATLQDVEIPVEARAFRARGEPVLRAEAAFAHQQRFGGVVEGHRQHIRALIEAGLATPAIDYLAAREAIDHQRNAVRAALDGVDALLLPVAPTTAPLGLESTGDATLCALASFTGLPAIALPAGVASDGLPLAVQLIGAAGAEAKLLRVAAWVERRLDFRARPPLSSA